VKGVVQSEEVPQNGFGESNRRSPVKAASEVEVVNKEGSRVVESYVDADNVWLQLADVAASRG
jgi:hypothetical protein